MFLPDTVCAGERAGSLPLAGLEGARPGWTIKPFRALVSGRALTVWQDPPPRTPPHGLPGFWPLGWRGISGALPAIGNEPRQILLPVVPTVLVRTQDMVLFLAFQV